jgi:hypothetical protein
MFKVQCTYCKYNSNANIPQRSLCHLRPKVAIVICENYCNTKYKITNVLTNQHI